MIDVYLSKKRELAEHLSQIIYVLHDIPERREIIIPPETVHAVIDRNEPHAHLAHGFHVHADFQIFTSKPAHIFDAYHPDIPLFNLFQHCHKAGAVKPDAGNPVVRKMPYIPKTVPFCIVLQKPLLVGNAVALALQFVI